MDLTLQVNHLSLYLILMRQNQNNCFGNKKEIQKPVKSEVWIYYCLNVVLLTTLFRMNTN